jgi:hypothetical protein
VTLVVYCVESPVLINGKRVGYARYWTPFKERAEAQRDAVPGRGMRTVTGDDIPADVRTNALKALGEEGLLGPSSGDKHEVGS